MLVQHENEFVFTFPRGYHAGFNMDFNCAESINFAIDSWVDLGRRARVCECVADSVKIDVDAVLAEHELLSEIERQKAEKAAAALLPKPTPVHVPKKRKLVGEASANGGSPSPAGSPAPSSAGAPKKARTQTGSSAASDTRPPASYYPPPPPPPPPVVYQPPEPPCVLCPSLERSDLMAVVAVPPSIAQTNTQPGKVWLAHERCAANIPEVSLENLAVRWCMPD